MDSNEKSAKEEKILFAQEPVTPEGEPEEEDVVEAAILAAAKESLLRYQRSPFVVKKMLGLPVAEISEAKGSSLNESAFGRRRK